MTRIFKFAGPLFRAVGSGANWLGGAADKNPKTNTAVGSLLALGAGVFGISPEGLAGIGNMLVKFGHFLGGV